MTDKTLEGKFALVTGGSSDWPPIILSAILPVDGRYSLRCAINSRINKY
jgi:hypothetical protein